MSEVKRGPRRLSDLARALGRWDNEGGASIPPSGRPDLALQAADDERLMRCLGAAVVLHWNNLPTEIQHDLFESVVSMGDRALQLELTQQLGRYLHQHKDDD